MVTGSSVRYTKLSRSCRLSALTRIPYRFSGMTPEPFNLWKENDEGPCPQKEAWSSQYNPFGEPFMTGEYGLRGISAIEGRFGEERRCRTPEEEPETSVKKELPKAAASASGRRRPDRGNTWQDTSSSKETLKRRKP